MVYMASSYGCRLLAMIKVADLVVVCCLHFIVEAKTAFEYSKVRQEIFCFLECTFA